MQTVKVAFGDLSGPTSASRRFGTATFAFDGVEEYRCTMIELHAQVMGHPGLILMPGSAKFAEVVKVLERERGEEIVARINDELEQGGYMALHGRNMPRGGIKPAPRRDDALAA